MQTRSMGQPHDLPWGTVIPGGLGGVRSDGAGGILLDEPARTVALDRVRETMAEARHGGIPDLTRAGGLPAGLHQASFGELQTRFASTPRRAELTEQLDRALRVMRSLSVEQAVVGGSYVGTKARPGDVDVAVLPRDDGRRIDMLRVAKRVARVAPDVHPYPAWNVVMNARTMPSATAGETFLEFFLHDRTGAARGAVLLSELPEAPPRTSLLTRIVGVLR